MVFVLHSYFTTLNKLEPDKSVPKQTVRYNGQKWEYKGYKWLEAGILSLELKLVGSNGGTELVREIEVHRDNPEGLLGLWKATPRPEPSSEKYEPLQVVEKTEDGRYRMQWTGFDALENTSLEPPWRIRKIAPELLKEYRNKQTGNQAKRPAKTSTRAIKAAKQRKPQRPRRGRRQPLQVATAFAKSGGLRVNSQNFASAAAALNYAFGRRTSRNLREVDADMSHAADVLKKIEDDRDGDFCDLTIASGPFRFAVHRVVVCAQSQVIRTACTGPWKEAASGVLEVKEWPAELVRRMVDYMYTGTYADWPAEANEQGDVRGEGRSCFSEPMIFHANMVLGARCDAYPGLPGCLAFVPSGSAVSAVLYLDTVAGLTCTRVQGQRIQASVRAYIVRAGVSGPFLYCAGTQRHG
ncbi:hypothetical protein ACQRIU_006966 [Beauveria bassiana]